MNVRDRRQMVLERLQETGAVSVSELSENARVSAMTIRRDLEALEQLGALRRVHGGAVTGVSRSYEPGYVVRAGRAQEAKRRIGRRAAEMLRDGDAAIIDVGSTPLEVARALPPDAHLTVLTPSLRAAVELADRAGLRLIVTGGIVQRGEWSLVGDLAEAAFDGLRPDVAFLGVGGIDLKAGATEFSLDDARVKRAAVESASRCVVLADASKLNKIAFARICPLADIDVLITDTDDQSLVDPLRNAGLEVVTV